MSMILKFNEIKKEDVLTAGGKGANLGEMTKAQIAVPNGFVVTADAYRAFLKENNLEEVFQKELTEADRSLYRRPQIKGKRKRQYGIPVGKDALCLQTARL